MYTKPHIMKKNLLATVIFVIHHGQILLATKMKKVGAGLLNGYGGKEKSSDISLRHTACRELFEESGEGILVEPENLVPRCLIDFYFFDNHTDEPNWSVAFYLAFNFSGTASTTVEMADPTWHPLDTIPYDQMLPADQEFVPKILDTENHGTFRGLVRFSQDGKSVLSSEYHFAPLEI
jgi:8-oxo-dGTP diphosphatase